jgi:hypothetical protein
MGEGVVGSWGERGVAPGARGDGCGREGMLMLENGGAKDDLADVNMRLLRRLQGEEHQAELPRGVGDAAVPVLSLLNPKP